MRKQLGDKAQAISDAIGKKSADWAERMHAANVMEQARDALRMPVDEGEARGGQHERSDAAKRVRRRGRSAAALRAWIACGAGRLDVARWLHEDFGWRAVARGLQHTLRPSAPVGLGLAAA